jgi:hypothetical protein
VIDDQNTESRIGHRAMPHGFQVVCTRGREEQGRRASGQGVLMLLDTDKDIIFTATLEEIATCLKTGEEAPTLRRSIKRTPGDHARAFH